MGQFATFDAGKARCFLARDRDQMLAVIEAGFGDFYDFNRASRQPPREPSPRRAIIALLADAPQRVLLRRHHAHTARRHTRGPGEAIKYNT